MDFIATIIFFVVLFSILKMLLVQDRKYDSKDQVLHGELIDKDSIRSCNEQDVGCGFQGKLIDESVNHDDIRKVMIIEEEHVVKHEKIETWSGRKIDEIETIKSEKIESCKSEDDREVGEEEGGSVDEENDWEGIESTELERRFGAAVAFVGSKTNADITSSLSDDLKLQLYGLHKIAIQGPCNVPQPMAFKVSARAKWNAWKQLGDMPREVAMEQYVKILSGMDSR